MNRRRAKRGSRSAAEAALIKGRSPGASGKLRSAMVEVAAGLVFRGDKLLITRRLADAHLGGLWEFPGGKREPDETYEACLERELNEELGIRVRVGELIETVTHDYPGKAVHLQFYRCKWESGEPELLGCAELKWIKWSELSAYQFPAADRRLIEMLRDSPGLWAGAK